MFDVRNHTAGKIRICGMKLNLAQSAVPLTLEVYTVTDGTTCVGKQSTAASWTLHQTITNVTSLGDSNNTTLLTPIPSLTPIVLDAGQQLGVLVSCLESSQRYSNSASAAGTLLATDGALSVYTGYGKGRVLSPTPSAFGSTFNPRNPHIEFQYAPVLPVITLTVGANAYTSNTTTTVESGSDTTVGSAAVGNATTDTGTLTSSDVTTSGTCPTLSTITRTWSATNADGTSTLVQTINVNDFPPIIASGSLTLNRDVTLDAACSATTPDYRAEVAAVATDAITATNALTVTQSPAAGTAVTSDSVQSVTVTVTDGCSSTSTVVYTVTYDDATAPTVAAPANYVLRATDGAVCDRVVTFGVDGASATTTDACDTSVAISYNPASGSAFGIGTTPVTVTATDDDGNTATATFSVTVSFDWSSLTTVTPAFTPTDIEIADVTGDGHLDAVVGGASSVAIYAGDGTGALALLATTSVTGDVVRLAASDVDGDGDADVAVASSNAGTTRLTVLAGTATGFAVTPIYVSDLATTSPTDIGIVDLGAGLFGVVVTAAGGGTTLVTLAATPTTAALGTNGSRDVVTADLDDDGDTDIAILEDAVIRLWTNGSGAFADAGTLAAPATTTFAHLVVADFDGDAHDDDLAASGTTTTPEGMVAVYLNAGTSGALAARFAAPVTRTSTTYASMTDLAVADLQADGVVDAGTGQGLRIGLDLLAANNGVGSSDDAVAVSRFDGTSPEVFAACTSTGGPVAVATGDLDGNGIVDMITANAGGTLRILLSETRALGEPFGTPYPASAYAYIPHITSDALAIMGTTASVNLSGARPYEGGMLACSTSSMLTEVSGVGSGTNLYLGFPIYILPSLAGVVLSGSGTASITFAIHPTLFLGERLLFQWAVFDGATAAGYALTEGLLLRVGR